jgi:uncharacterized protein YodC (DUF2158 family)
MAFKIGDIVQLKSGGPKMTVTSGDSTHIWTSWFAGAKHETARFAVASLNPVVEEEKK